MEPSCSLSSLFRLGLALGAAAVVAHTGFANTHKDTYYVNDHLASTVATVDAAGEIAQIEADAFGTQAGAVAKDSRFTGKPYDADMGAYVFPFRNYRSDEARWMSADPSGFPDGVNQQCYTGCPLIGIDRMGLAWNSLDFVSHYYFGSGDVTLTDIELQEQVIASANNKGVQDRLADQIDATAANLPWSYCGEFTYVFYNAYNFSDVSFAMGSGSLAGIYRGAISSQLNGSYLYTGSMAVDYFDVFIDPLSVIEFLYGSSTSANAPLWVAGLANFGGSAYLVTGNWNWSFSGGGQRE